MARDRLESLYRYLQPLRLVEVFTQYSLLLLAVESSDCLKCALINVQLLLKVRSYALVQVNHPATSVVTHHFAHAVDSDNSDLVVEVVLVDEALLQHDLEQERALVHIHTFELSRLKLRALV